jgi:(1->4)-alpha-D-glucan 1-alpha-D-glucosylmutase
MADEAFRSELTSFVEPLVAPGRVNSLAQQLLKLTSPGVPDVYQGTEVWDLSLVDPDNRRPVDYDRRRRLLEELPGLTPGEIMARSDDGLPKLWVTTQALHLRRRRPELFGAEGGYTPVEARGDERSHVVAFVRGGAAMTVVPRLLLAMEGEWGDTTVEVPDGAWRNLLTGEQVSSGETSAASLLSEFPVALLEREPA